MNKLIQRSVAAAAFLAFAAGSAQAATWQLVDNGSSFDFFDLSADFNGSSYSKSLGLADQSSAGHFLQTGTSATTQGLPTGGATLQFHGQQEVDTQGGSSTAKLLIDGVNLLGFQPTSSGTLGGYTATQDIGVTGLQLKIQGDANEADGSAVQVAFSGTALADFVSSIAAEQEVGLSLLATIGGNVVATQDWFWSSSQDTAVNFSFGAAVGDVVELTLSLHSGATQGADHAYTAPQAFSTGIGTRLSGDLTVTSAVPEPASWMLLLAGAGAMVAARARRSR